MRKFIPFFMYLLFAFIVIGCSKNASGQPEESAPQPQQENEENAGMEEENEIVEEVEEEDEGPAMIDVVDPNTKEIVRTIIPEEMGYGSDDGKFREELEKWARDLARGTEDSEGYDKKMVPDRLNEDGTITKGRPRIILDESELVDRIIAAADAGGTVELPIYVYESGYDPEEVPHLDETVVAKYTTYFDVSAAGRAKNIELSAAALNNIIIGRGDYFSFNETVGPREVERGYQTAPEIVNGKLVDGIGGGVCQTSSTLFNAVDQLGVKYIERHHHSLPIGYVPAGRDATVSYGGLDFRFQNEKDIPFLLKAYVDGGVLTVEVRTSAEYANQL